MPTEIRPARAEELPRIAEVHRQAFDGRPNEPRLVELLHAHGKAPISLVASLDGQAVAHVLFSPVTMDPPHPSLNAVGLAPVGVLPGHQKQGIGSRLIREGLRACREAGYDAVVVLGDPRYYSRFGFSRARDYGLGNEYGADGDFMVLELKPGALADVRGTVRYAPEFAETGC